MGLVERAYRLALKPSTTQLGNDSKQGERFNVNPKAPQKIVIKGFGAQIVFHGRGEGSDGRL